jgi:three-Cys-motif partner protein
MPTGDSVVGADGELAIRVGPWAKDKLFYIGRYCYIFNVGMKNKWPIRTYIDLFTGPGRCLIEGTNEEIDGSPLIALNCGVPFTHYFFNDIELSFIEVLQARAKPFDSAVISYFSRNCNEIIDELIQKLPLDSLDFCFIDPTNWQINFDSIRRLTEKRQMDIAVTFHVGAMKRIASEPTQDLLDFFPDSSCQQEYEEAREMHRSTGRALLDAYEQGLKNLGYVGIKDYVLETNTRNVPLYHLIFASKHPKGAEFWDKIALRSEAGQLRMAM